MKAPTTKVLAGLAFCAALAALYISFSDRLLSDSPSVAALVSESQQKRSLNLNELDYRGGLDASDIPRAIEFVESHPDYSSYHLLMAIRTQYPEIYQDISKLNKAAVFCSALENLTYVNDWGSLYPPRDGISAVALLEIGPDCIPRLMLLLGNEREALLSGSIEAAASSVHRFRRKDYAFRYISLLIGREATFAQGLEARDAKVNELRRELEKKWPARLR